MAKSRADVELCKGCRLCTTICPTGAITPLTRVNKSGYEIIAVDEEKCVGCGLCYKICPHYVFVVE